MSKKFFTSEILNKNSKKIKKMISASPEFENFVKEYEEKTKKHEKLKQKASLTEQEEIEFQKFKKEKVFIAQQIEAYKQNSSLWIQSNGPSCIKEQIA